MDPYGGYGFPPQQPPLQAPAAPVAPPVAAVAPPAPLFQAPPPAVAAPFVAPPESDFTAEEDAHLLALSESDLPRGARRISWERVATGLPTVGGRRKGMDVKNRYNTLKKRKRPAARMVL